MNFKKSVLLLIHLCPVIIFGQLLNDSMKIAAGSEYILTPFQQLIKSSNYRKVWAKPVMVPAFTLKNAATINIILNEQKRKILFAEINGQRFILKTPDRFFPDVLDIDINGTFIEKLLNDKVSAFYPYAEAVVGELADSANLFNTDCKYVYLSNNHLPDSLAKDFSNRLYALESIKEQNNISEFISNLISTDSLIKMKLQGRVYATNEKVFLRTRLFDLWVNDWKTEDAEIKWVRNAASNMLSPIVINRDRSFFYYNGIIFKTLLGFAHLNYIQPFEAKMQEKKIFEIAAKNNDRFFTTSLTKSEWMLEAEDLKQRLTDNLIHNSLKNLPSEIYPISSQTLFRKLKLRRKSLTKVASDYYNYLSTEIDLPGSNKNEVFLINQATDSTTTVLIKRDEEIVYQSEFNSNFTKQLRIYGINGVNKFEVYTKKSNQTQIKIIGGIGNDSIIHNGSGKIEVFENPGNYLKLNRSDKRSISSDTAINRFSYQQYTYTKHAFVPAAFYSNEDLIYVSAGYRIRNFKWRKIPFASNHLFEIHYSLMDKGVSAYYKGLINNLIAKSNLSLLANYDQIRWTPFFGLGNTTSREEGTNAYYRFRTTEWNAAAMLNRNFGAHKFSFGGVFQSLKILKDQNGYIYKEIYTGDSLVYSRRNWAGLQLGYQFTLVNDSIVPTKGIVLKASASFNKNFNAPRETFEKYSFSANGIIPLSEKISFSTTAGIQTVAGNPFFFQYPFIGGPTLRGFVRNRFWGKTVFFNNNELRYITHFRSPVFNGKAGLMAFLDNGRVWMNKNEPGKFHFGYGVGIIAVPFYKILLNGTIGHSKDGIALQFKAIQYF